MSETPRKSGKKNRKFGRSTRRPSHNRYTIERRWEKNKERRAVKIARTMEKKAARKARRQDDKRVG
jgi:hypothetical protein